jgi:hypothetical protein
MLVTGVGTSFELREGASREGLSEAASLALEEICRIVPELVKSYPALG